MADVEPAPPVMPWLAAALGGSVVAAGAGWVVVVGITVLGWLSGGTGTLSAAITVGTRLWLLANGAGATIIGTPWTLIPLGVTAVVVVAIAQVAGFAARQAVAARHVDPRPTVTLDQEDDADRSVLRWVVGVVSLVYVAAVGVVALSIGTTAQAVRGMIVAAVVAVSASTLGAARTMRLDLTATWPEWLRPVPRAVAASVGVVALGGCAAVVTALVLYGDRVSAMTTGLGVSAVGGVVLMLLQLAFWPNLIMWAASWTLGAGFTLGDGSVVSPAETDLGLLPNIPVFGAVPPEGAGGWSVLAWLAVGVVAGVVGASVVVRSRPAGRFDETTLVGGLAGVTSGLVLVGLAALSTGDLGDGRLVGLGPRLLELTVMSVTLLGLSGMVTGLVWGLVRRAERPAADEPDPDEELTVHAMDLEPDEDVEATTVLTGDPDEERDDEATTDLTGRR